MLREKFEQLIRRYRPRKARKAAETRRRVGVESLENRHLMAVMLGWDFSNIAVGDFGASPRSANTVDANVSSVVGLTRGAGISKIDADANGRGFGGEDVDGVDLATAITDSDTFSFGFTVPALTRVSLSSLDYSALRVGLGGGGTTGQWQYNVGAGFVSVGSAFTVAGTSTTTNLPLSSVTALQSMGPGTVVSFRLAVWGASNNSIEFYLNDFTNNSSNDLILNGTAVTAPVLATPTSTSITSSGATLGSNVTSDGGASATSRGFVYAKTSVNSNPQIGGTGTTNVVVGSGTGAFSSAITGLEPGVAYSFVAYGVNSVGTRYTSPVSSFTTLAAAPTVTSPTSSGVTAFTATLGGNVTLANGASVTSRGIVYAKTSDNANPQIGGAGVTVVTSGSGTGVFTTNVTGLSEATGYSFVAFATNSVGTTYTTPVSTFSTPALPTVSSVLVNDGIAFLNAAQRSQVVSLKVTFSTSVTLNPGAFSIANIDPATAATLANSGAGNQIFVNGSAFNSNVTGTVFVITFGSGTSVTNRSGGTTAGVSANSLSDGNYQLTIDKTKVTDANSGNLAADRLFGNVMSDKFFRLFGDSDGDGDVDATDNNNFRRAQTIYNAALDLEGDGSVGSTDATALRNNLNKRRRSF